jgi:hypothetical protein
MASEKSMASETPQIFAIHHLVHEYANFVSSAEMTIDGKDVDGDLFKAPINTHVSHAFYLNCRKLADFFQNKSYGNDDMLAMHFVSGYTCKLPLCDEWRKPINKQLAHVTYARDVDSREIEKEVCKGLYRELKETWREFRRQLPEVYAAEFKRKVEEKKAPYSEFRNYDLD